MANYVLEILDGDRAGEVLPVTDRMLRIGRKPGNDIVLADEKTSGVHCEIAPEGDRLVLKDLGSTNGTFLDGKRITEIVLTPGDVVTIGRLRVKFRDADDSAAAAGADGDEFAIRKLDAARLQRRGGSTALLAGLLVVVLGAGGWFYWQQSQQQGDAEQGQVTRRKDPLVVSGNRLAAAIANCESTDGFDLAAGGVAFRTAGQANSGAGSFVAERGEAGDGGEEVAVAGYAVLRVEQPLKVAANHSFVVSGHCRTEGAARIAVRAHVFSSGEQVPFRFVGGSKLQACADGWQQLEAAVAVPSGCDSLQVEVVALLPGDDAAAYVDDLAVVEGGDAAVVETRLEESGQTLIGFGSSLAVRSTDAANAATVLELRPAQVAEPMRELHAAGLLTLSDLGAALQVDATERSFKIAASGVPALQFVFPADAASNLLVAGEQQAFASTAANEAFSARRVLLGSHSTRAMLRFEQPVQATGRTAGGLYRLDVPGDAVELVLGFRAERREAGEHVRAAQLAYDEGRPGDALDRLAKVFTEVPMDSEVLARARELHTKILAEQTERLQALQSELDEAGFFSTRGGFERVATGVQRLRDRYYERNLEDAAAVEELRKAAEARLQAFDRAAHGAQRERLQDLADAFAAQRQTELEQLVTSYIATHLGDG